MSVFEMSYEQLSDLSCESDLTLPNPGSYPLQLLVEEYTLTGDDDVLKRIEILGKTHDPEKSDGDHIYSTMDSSTKVRFLDIATRIKLNNTAYKHVKRHTRELIPLLRPKFYAAVDLVLDGWGDVLLDTYPDIVHVKNSFGCNILMYAVENSVVNNLKPIIERMLRLGADPNAVDTDDNLSVSECIVLNLPDGDSDVETLNMVAEYGGYSVVSKRDLDTVYMFGPYEDVLMFMQYYLRSGGNPVHLPEAIRSLVETAMWVAVKNASLKR